MSDQSGAAAAKAEPSRKESVKKKVKAFFKPGSPKPGPSSSDAVETPAAAEKPAATNDPPQTSAPATASGENNNAPANGELQTEGTAMEKMKSKAIHAYDEVNEHVDLQEYIDGAGDFIEGFTIAVQGAWNALHQDRIVMENTEMIRACLWQMTIYYGVALVLMLLFFPITLPLLFITPGSFISFFYYVPFVALNEVREDHQSALYDMFIEGMDTRDQVLAKEMRDEVQKNPDLMDWTPNPLIRMRKKKHFLTRAGIASASGFIPLVGWIIAPCLSMLFLAKGHAWNILMPYMHNVLGWDYETQKKWVHDNRFLLMGYSIAYVSVSAVPFVGALVVAVSQAGAPYLLSETMMAQGHEKYEGKKTN